MNPTVMFNQTEIGLTFQHDMKSYLLQLQTSGLLHKLAFKYLPVKV